LSTVIPSARITPVINEVALAFGAPRFRSPNTRCSPMTRLPEVQA